MLDASTIHALNSINWNFSGNLNPTRAAHRLLDARSVHWYPATYIPEIPYSLIELLSRPGDKVMDPFAGIGTTLWQALALGRDAYGSELTIVGQDVCAGLWNLLASDTDVLGAYEQVLSVLRQWNGVDLVGAFLTTTSGSLLQPWFSAGTFKELAFLYSAQQMMTDPTARHLLKLSISAVLASVSEQKRGWGCIADNMKPREIDIQSAPATREPIDKVIGKARGLVRTVLTAKERLPIPDAFVARAADEHSHLFFGNSITSGALDEGRDFDLIVTSPPYPAMVDYSTAQRLSYYWNGVLPERDVVLEIGARRRRFSSKSLSDYTTEMTRAVAAMSSSLKVGGRLAIVIPAFTTSGADDPRSLALQEVFGSSATSSLELCWETDRILPTGRRQLNQKWTSLQRENIRVYERIE